MPEYSDDLFFALKNAWSRFRSTLTKIQGRFNNARKTTTEQDDAAQVERLLKNIRK